MFLGYYSWQQPYHVENTSSRLITEVKQHWAWLVLGWETAWEHQVPLSIFLPAKGGHINPHYLFGLTLHIPHIFSSSFKCI